MVSSSASKEVDVLLPFPCLLLFGLKIDSYTPSQIMDALHVVSEFNSFIVLGMLVVLCSSFIPGYSYNSILYNNKCGTCLKMCI